MAGMEARAIRDLIDARNDAVRAGDTARAMAAMAKDVVTFDLAPPLQLTGAPARDTAGMEEWLATWDGPVSVVMPEPTVVVEGDIAFAHGLSRMRGVKRGEGPIDLWYRSTLCLKRGPDGWSLLHEHHSVPMKMDGSGLAATDLHP
ncbi:MAG: nuclear transport factor 2 family protein [Aurantimonas endophytica]|uniref:YybH family protein n=1 Tax=Aurantimonas endophytica TaxID=1522175 RepID=UPI003002BAB5